MQSNVNRALNIHVMRNVNIQRINILLLVILYCIFYAREKVL